MTEREIGAGRLDLLGVIFLREH